MAKGENLKREKIKLVESKNRYPGLKPLIKPLGLTYKAIYRQFDRMRPEQFSNIVGGYIPEPDGFLEAMLGALKTLGVDTTEEILRKDPNEQVNI